MGTGEGLRVSDAAVVARYLLVRSHFHDRLLPRVESHIEAHYRVGPSRRLAATLVALVRGGYERPGEGDLWPVVFLTPVDVSLALCLRITPERVTSMGTVLNGPQRIRHRHWEDWWGWETALAPLRPDFFDLSDAAQDDAMVGWYVEHLEWLAQSGLMQRR
jgi:hypothetical protein